MSSRTVNLLRRERMDTSLPVLIDLMVATKTIEDKSPRTVDWYKQMLQGFVDFLGDSATVADVTFDNARAYIASLRERSERFVDHPRRSQQKGGLAPRNVLT